MTSDVRRVGRWLRRAQPGRAALARALVAGYVSSMVGVGLLAGAVGLLVASANRPGLRAVAIVLVVIELFAFARSPLRFVERLAAHRLGFSATSTWRAWLARTVGHLDYGRWRAYASGELLERALTDTDELQILWLRFVVPLVATLATALSVDVVVLLIAPRGRWWPVAVTLLLVVALATGLLTTTAANEARRDRALRVARGAYRAQIVELAAAAPELALLGRSALLQRRSDACVRDVTVAELARDRARLPGSLITLLASLVAVAALVQRPTSSPTWLAVVAVVGLTTYDLLDAVRGALGAAVLVSGGGERLESLAGDAATAVTDWPRDTTLTLRDLTIDEGGQRLIDGADLAIEPGRRVAIAGPSGVGKSSLLRVLANLERPTRGHVNVGDRSLTSIDDEQLRRHLTYVPAEPGLTRGYALDVLQLGRACVRDVFGDLLSLDLVATTSTRWEELSRGERLRVALVRALATGPSIVLLDEPTAGLGGDDITHLLDLLERSGATVVVATHDPRVMAWCEHVVTLHDAKLDDDGPREPFVEESGNESRPTLM